MHCIAAHTAASRAWRPAAAAFASTAWLLLPPAAVAQTQPPAEPQSGPQAEPGPQSPSPASGISDKQLNAAAKAIGRVTAVKRNYAQKIATAQPADKERVVAEANNALTKAVTDQGLSIDEYNAILQRAQTDAALRQRLVERIRPTQQ
jgi:Domain of unknown function (DUF4168)